MAKANTHKVVTLVACATLVAQCAAVRAPLPQVAPSDANTSAMLAVAQRMPAGSRVQLTLDDGRRLRGTLLAVEGDDLVVRERTRLPEAALRIDVAHVVSIELDELRTGIGKMIAIGAAIGAGVTLAFLAILAAAISD
jgi:hypothetical protein